MSILVVAADDGGGAVASLEADIVAAVLGAEAARRPLPPPPPGVHSLASVDSSPRLAVSWSIRGSFKLSPPSPQNVLLFSHGRRSNETTIAIELQIKRKGKTPELSVSPPYR